LAWLLHQPNVLVIPGASSVEQLEANVAAADLVLAADEVAALRAAAEAFRPVGGLAAAPRVVAGWRTG
jgi:aryl-alcohol dehydrogenase-like predicted oxidoreductase